MADIYNCSYKLTGELFEAKSSEGVYSDQIVPQPQQYQINLNFFCEVVLDQRVLHDGSVFRQEVVLPERLHNIVRLSLTKLSDLDNPQYEQFIKFMIGRWLNLAEGEAEWMSIEAIESVVIVTGSALPSHKIFDLEFKLSMVYTYDLVPRTFEDGERLFQQMMEETGAPKMVPATNESIKNLKRKKVEDDCEGDCMICLDQFSKGHEAVSMPCSHLFHGDCIEGWLKTSHYCPLCRFEMPTS